MGSRVKEAPESNGHLALARTTAGSIGLCSRGLSVEAKSKDWYCVKYSCMCGDNVDVL